MSLRVVFDTVVSALLFANGRPAWLRQHWREGACAPLISRATAAELNRVLGYPKFRLSSDDRRELLADYLPNCEIVEHKTLPVRMPRPTRSAFSRPCQSGRADLLISGDHDLIVLAGQTSFVIETPGAYRCRVADEAPS